MKRTVFKKFGSQNNQRTQKIHKIFTWDPEQALEGSSLSMKAEVTGPKCPCKVNTAMWSSSLNILRVWSCKQTNRNCKQTAEMCKQIEVWGPIINVVHSKKKYLNSWKILTF